MGIDSGESNTGHKTRKNLGIKATNQLRKVTIVTMVKGSNDNLMGDKVGQKELGLKVQKCNVWETKGRNECTSGWWTSKSG